MSKKSTDAVDFTIGKNIQATRLDKGLTQRQLAEQIGVSYQQLQKYENGVNRVTVSMLVKIAAVLDAPPTRFLDEKQDTGVAETARLSEEIADLVDLYAGIKSAKTRKVVMAMLSDMAKEDIKTGT